MPSRKYEEICIPDGKLILIVNTIFGKIKKQLSPFSHHVFS